MPPPSSPTGSSSAALRWLVTLQAALGATFLVALLVLASILAVYALGVAGGPIWTSHPLWAGIRLSLSIPALVAWTTILGWMWAPLPTAAGLVLDRDEAPDFHALIDSLRIRFGIRHALQLRVTGEMNAAVLARPRSVTLQVGLPLLLSVTPKQCAAILAHELGHLCVQRRGPGAWAAQLRAWWHRVLEHIDQDGSLLGRVASFVISRADRRYVGDALRLSHAEEYEADAWAACTVGAEPLAGALFAVALKDRFLQDDFWRKVHAQADHTKQPLILPFQQMAAALKAGYDPDEALASFTGDDDEEDSDDSHPSISARCARLAVAPHPHGTEAATAAEIYLPAALPRLALELDKEWWAANGNEWNARHREVRRARRRIERLRERNERLGATETLELAGLVERYGGDSDALDLYFSLLDDPGCQGQATLAVGRLLIERGNPEGVNYLLRCLNQDSEAGLAAAVHLLAFAQSHGFDWMSQRALRRASQLLRVAQTIREEAEADPLGAGWQPHGLDAFTRRQLARGLAGLPGIRRAYLVRRSSPGAPSWHAYVLILRADGSDEAFREQVTEIVGAVLAEESPVRILTVERDSDWERRAIEVSRSRLPLERMRRPPAERLPAAA